MRPEAHIWVSDEVEDEPARSKVYVRASDIQELKPDAENQLVVKMSSNTSFVDQIDEALMVMYAS